MALKYKDFDGAYNLHKNSGRNFKKGKPHTKSRSSRPQKRSYRNPRKRASSIEGWLKQIASEEKKKRKKYEKRWLKKLPQKHKNIDKLIDASDEDRFYKQQMKRKIIVSEENLIYTGQCTICCNIIYKPPKVPKPRATPTTNKHIKKCHPEEHICSNCTEKMTKCPLCRHKLISHSQRCRCSRCYKAREWWWSSESSWGSDWDD